LSGLSEFDDDVTGELRPRIDSLMSGHCRCFVCTLLIRRVVMPVTFLLYCCEDSSSFSKRGSLIDAHNCFISNRFMAHYESFCTSPKTSSSSCWLSTFVSAFQLWFCGSQQSSGKSCSLSLWVKPTESNKGSVITNWWKWWSGILGGSMQIVGVTPQ